MLFEESVDNCCLSLRLCKSECTQLKNLLSRNLANRCFMYKCGILISCRKCRLCSYLTMVCYYGITFGMSRALCITNDIRVIFLI